MSVSIIYEVCGLPRVPFGGEDVCISSAHRLGYEDGDVPDDLRDEREDEELLPDDRACDTCDGNGCYMINAHGPQEVICEDCAGTGRTLARSVEAGCGDGREER